MPRDTWTGRGTPFRWIGRYVETRFFVATSTFLTRTSQAYPDEIAELLGVMPKLLNHPKIIVPLLLCPVLPPHYRLDGPGKWDGAEAEVQKLWQQVRNHRPNKEAGYGWDDDDDDS